MKRYAVAGRHPWNRRHCETLLKKNPGQMPGARELLVDTGSTAPFETSCADFAS